MSAPPHPGGFSLFPSTGRPPSRSQAVRTQQQQQQQQAVSPVSPAAPADAVSPVSPANQSQPQPQPQSQHPTVGEAFTAEVRIERPPPVADVLWRSDAAQTDAQTLVRNGSARSRSSIAKMRLSIYDSDALPPLDTSPPPPLPGPSSSAAAAAAYGQIFPQEQQQEQQQQQSQSQSQSQPQQYEQQQQQHPPPALRSIFPRYNPELSLDQQEYYPTQTSPGRIPRGIISRPLYSPTQQEQEQEHQQMDLDGTHEQHQNQNQHQHQHQSPYQYQYPYQQPSQQTPQAGRLTLQTGAPALAASAVYSPLSAGVTNAGVVSSTTAAAPVRQVWPPLRMDGARDTPTLPVPSTTEELRSFWKVANGWKAGPSEGRVYCMRMSCDKDAPVYRLSSASHQPLYRMRLDPTSMSAYVTLSRHDPARPFKPESGRGKGGRGDAFAAAGGGGAVGGSQGGSRRASMDGDSVIGGGSGGSSGAADAGAGASGAGMGSVSAAVLAAETQANARFDASKHWQSTLTTTLEEEARRHQPNDGLVALLYPQQAARMALEQPGSATAVATAERECARLVWDDDSARYFVVHPVLALPFCVGVERSATWSRTAYTLEHLESPQHLARLTRDGTGAGWLEVDTAVASKIDAVYLVDVAVAALLLVAHGDAQFAQVGTFAPPPVLAQGGHMGGMAGSGAAGPGAAAAAASGGRASFGSGTPRGSLINIVMNGAAAAAGHRSSSRLSNFAGPGDDRHKSKNQNKSSKNKNKKRSRMEELELDLESQTSIDLGGKAFELVSTSRKKSHNKSRRHGDDDDEKMPGCLRLIAALLKCCFWCVAMAVRVIIAVVSVLFRCITNEKL